MRAVGRAAGVPRRGLQDEPRAREPARRPPSSRPSRTRGSSRRRSTSPATAAGRATRSGFPASPRGTAGTRRSTGRKRFFFFNLFESDETGAPLAVRSRVGGLDRRLRRLRRPLARNARRLRLPRLLPPGLRLRLAPRRAGLAARRARPRGRGVGQLMDAAGGPDELLERYAVVVCADHGQTHVDERREPPGRRSPTSTSSAARRDDPAPADVVVTALEPLRDGLPPRPAARLERARARRAARRRAGRRRRPLPRGRRRGGAPRRGRSFASGPEDGGWRSPATPTCSTRTRYPNGLERAWHALACPNAGEVIVSAAGGLRVRRPRRARTTRAAGATARSLAGDSTVPIVAAGFERAALPERPRSRARARSCSRISASTRPPRCGQARASVSA